MGYWDEVNKVTRDPNCKELGSRGLMGMDVQRRSCRGWEEVEGKAKRILEFWGFQWQGSLAQGSSRTRNQTFVVWCGLVQFSYPGTHRVDKAGLKLKELPASVRVKVWGLKVCATTAQLFLKKKKFKYLLLLFGVYVFKFAGARVTGICEPPDMDDSNWSQVICDTLNCRVISPAQEGLSFWKRCSVQKHEYKDI